MATLLVIPNQTKYCRRLTQFGLEVERTLEINHDEDASCVLIKLGYRLGESCLYLDRLQAGAPFPGDDARSAVRGMVTEHLRELEDKALSKGEPFPADTYRELEAGDELDWHALTSHLADQDQRAAEFRLDWPAVSACCVFSRESLCELFRGLILCSWNQHFRPRRDDEFKRLFTRRIQQLQAIVDHYRTALEAGCDSVIGAGRIISGQGTPDQGRQYLDNIRIRLEILRSLYSMVYQQRLVAECPEREWMSRRAQDLVTALLKRMGRLQINF